MTKPSFLPSPRKLKQLLAPSERALAFVDLTRQIHQNILTGVDTRKVFIVGPCSIHNLKSALEYAYLLKKLEEEVSDTCALVMRVYMEKPRTASGWKGFVYDPYLDGSGDIQIGLIWARKLLIALAEKGIACATEFVDPLVTPYLDDLISWGFIGARTVSSPPHRHLASSLNMPIGFKNSLDGNIETAIHAVMSAAESHCFLSMNQEGQLNAIRSNGNPHAHIVLRGSCERPNYDSFSITGALRLLKKHQLPSRILIDCAHGNAQKKTEKQKRVFENVLEQILQGNSSIFGVMLESHLEAGNQPMQAMSQGLHYATSLTDPCLDWKTTQELIHLAHLSLSGRINRDQIDPQLVTPLAERGAVFRDNLRSVR